MTNRCMDCLADYNQTCPLDIVLSKEQWLMINSDDGGLLCGNCILRRAAKLPHVINVQAIITFAEDYSAPGVTSSPTLPFLRAYVQKLEGKEGQG